MLPLSTPSTGDPAEDQRSGRREAAVQRRRASLMRLQRRRQVRG